MKYKSVIIIDSGFYQDLASQLDEYEKKGWRLVKILHSRHKYNAVDGWGQRDTHTYGILLRRKILWFF